MKASSTGQNSAGPEFSGKRFLGLMLRRLRFLPLIVPVLWWTACSTGALSPAYPPSTDASAASSAGTSELRAGPQAPAESRPGLATGYGDEIRDPMRRSSFVRSKDKPLGTDRIYYNDRSGIDAMTSYTYRTSGMRQASGGMVEWGIKSGFGHARTYESGDRRLVEGSPGKAYSIVVKNRCRSRVEVVLSVDGLDVMDGKPASTRKRGYLIDPGGTLEVKGWRSGHDTVAQFEFSSVGASYANRRHGDARNAGVIGLAVYGEKGVDPWKWMPGEVDRRNNASPFATAP